MKKIIDELGVNQMAFDKLGPDLSLSILIHYFSLSITNKLSALE